ncbi:hypothetical protein [Paenibacillus sp. R14(2021)]|uniref:hypothetical protein n=1 Tax=Paenibacillus sp. R14(2021) TaxID=2859228 RepID=UPI001C6133CC|nr:hypothetical protein [Paenibacillus sp. R14(2021)]
MSDQDMQQGSAFTVVSVLTPAGEHFMKLLLAQGLPFIVHSRTGRISYMLD